MAAPKKAPVKRPIPVVEKGLRLRINVTVPEDIKLYVLEFADTRPHAYDRRKQGWFGEAWVDWCRSLVYAQPPQPAVRSVRMPDEEETEEPPKAGGDWKMDVWG